MAPWNKNNPGVSDNPYINLGVDAVTYLLPFGKRAIRWTKGSKTGENVKLNPQGTKTIAREIALPDTPSGGGWNSSQVVNSNPLVLSEWGEKNVLHYATL